MQHNNRTILLMFWNLGNTLRSLSYGKGDCDSDLECETGLRCGNNNCKEEFGSYDTNWNWFDDCCTGIIMLCD